MSLYLLDTNTCVEVLRNRNQNVVRRFTATAPNDVRLCSVVKGELFYGARKGPRPTANLATLAVFFTTLPSLPFDDAAADIYGTIRADLEKRGKTEFDAYHKWLAIAAIIANRRTIIGVWPSSASVNRLAGASQLRPNSCARGWHRGHRPSAATPQLRGPSVSFRLFVTRRSPFKVVRPTLGPWMSE